jgi:hypothetical protein
MGDALVSTPRATRHLVGCAWFWAWTAVGVGGVLGAVSLGPLVLVPVLVVAALMASRREVRRSGFGLLSGAGMLLLYVAYVNRNGPGTTCWHTATASGCDEHLNPVPWLAAGTLLLIGGVIGHGHRARVDRDASPT